MTGISRPTSRRKISSTTAYIFPWAIFSFNALHRQVAADTMLDQSTKINKDRIMKRKWILFAVTLPVIAAGALFSDQRQSSAN
jgi:hypothetical protein